MHSFELLKTYSVQVLYTYLSTKHQEPGTKCPQAGVAGTDPRPGDGWVLLASLLEPRLQEEGYQIKSLKHLKVKIELWW